MGAGESPGTGTGLACCDPGILVLTHAAAPRPLKQVNPTVEEIDADLALVAGTTNLVQSVPYFATLLVSVISAFPRLPARLVCGSFCDEPPAAVVGDQL